MSEPRNEQSERNVRHQRTSLRQLRELFDSTPELDGVWIFGSRTTGKARANSDMNIAFDAPNMSAETARRLVLAIDELPTLYRIDAAHWQGVTDPTSRRKRIATGRTCGSHAGAPSKRIRPLANERVNDRYRRCDEAASR